MLIITIGITAIMFLIFKTNSLYAYDEDVISKSVYIPSQASSLSVKTQMQDLADAGSETISLSGEWYTDMPNLVADTSQKVQIGSLTAYKSYPFNSTETTFFYDVRKAKTDLWNYYDSLGAPEGFYHPTLESTLKNFACNGRMALTANCKIPSTGTTSAGTKYAIVDGVECYYCAPSPCTMDETFYSSGKWSEQSCSDFRDYGNIKFAFIVAPVNEDIENQANWLYIPFLVGDVKAHTYPWGVAQTNCSVVDTSTVNVAWYDSGGHEHNEKVQVGDTKTDEAVKTIVNSQYFTAYLGNVRDGLSCVLETYGMVESDCNKLFKDYTCMGIITYKWSN